jgi:hypothetical protein
MTDALLAPHFQQWQQFIAMAPPGDPEARFAAFEQCAQRGAVLIAKDQTVKRVVFDKLIEIASHHSNFGRDWQAIEAFVADAISNEPPDIDLERPWTDFDEIVERLAREREERERRKGNGRPPPPPPEPPPPEPQPPRPEPQPPPPKPPQEDLGEWDAGDDPGPIPPREWLLANQFCRRYISSLVAAGGVGKSALRLLQYISLALGRSLCDEHVFLRCRVLLLSLEDDDQELQRRIEAILLNFKIARSDLKGWLFCACPKRKKLAVNNNKNRTAGPLEREIRAAVERRKPDLVALDPFVKTHALTENEAGDMDFVCDLLASMASEFNIAVDSPHHVHKGTITPGDADAGRGSSGIKDAGRLIYTLVPMSEAEANMFGVSLEQRRRYIRLDSSKVNIIPPSSAATWFQLIGEPIGNGTPEYPSGDTVQVAVPWTPPNVWAGTSIATINIILTEIDRGLDNGQRYSAGNAKDRHAWHVVQRHYSDKTESQCREIIKKWVATGLLKIEDYEDPEQRKTRKGLRVDNTKRPGPIDDA